VVGGDGSPKSMVRLVPMTVGLVVVVSRPSSLTFGMPSLAGGQAGPPARPPPDRGVWEAGVRLGGVLFVCVCGCAAAGGLSGRGARCIGERGRRVAACLCRLRCCFALVKLLCETLVGAICDPGYGALDFVTVLGVPVLLFGVVLGSPCVWGAGWVVLELFEGLVSCIRAVGISPASDLQ